MITKYFEENLRETWARSLVCEITVYLSALLSVMIKVRLIACFYMNTRITLVFAYCQPSDINRNKRVSESTRKQSRKLLPHILVFFIQEHQDSLNMFSSHSRTSGNIDHVNCLYINIFWKLN